MIIIYIFILCSQRNDVNPHKRGPKKKEHKQVGDILINLKL